MHLVDERSEADPHGSSPPGNGLEPAPETTSRFWIDWLKFVDASIPAFGEDERSAKPSIGAHVRKIYSAASLT
jgi:hypothetical protein